MRPADKHEVNSQHLAHDALKSLSDTHGFGQLTLTDMLAGAASNTKDKYDRPGLNLTDLASSKSKDWNFNLASDLSGLDNNNNRAHSDSAHAAAERILKQKFDPDIDPGFTVRTEDNRPMHKLVQDRIRNSTSGISQKEDAAFEKLWNGLSKPQQDELKREYTQSHSHFSPDGLKRQQPIDGLSELPLMPKSKLEKFEADLQEAITPLEREREREQKTDAVYRELTDDQRRSLNAEFEVRPV